MSVTLPDEAWVVDMYKCSHQELTVESVHDTTMSWYGITEVLLEKKNVIKRIPRAYLWKY